MSDVTEPDNQQPHASKRMWTPWRMDYISGGPRETGCVFCNRLHGHDDRAALILHRGAGCFVIMNLFPYSTGHLMIVPNDHVAAPEDARPGALREMADLLPTCVAALRRAMHCDGFNVGMNLGAAAGAGVADHLHEHIVPRWVGDANFMPLLASTAVLPELIPVTYAKLRAEFERRSNQSIRLVVLDESARKILIDRGAGNARLPVALLEVKTPVWGAALDALSAIGLRARIVDWAGAAMANSEEPGALLLQATSGEPHAGFAWEPIASVAERGLYDADATIAARMSDPALLKEPT
jgi:ATP adenylyltransferase